MPSATFKKHIADIKSGHVTKTNVIGIRKALNALESHRPNRTSPKAEWDEVSEALDLLSTIRPIVTGDLHESGLKQIQNRRYRRNLERVADIVPNVARFRLVGYEQIGRRGEYAVPIYRAETEDGKAGFQFINIPWQSGGNGPELV